MWSIYPYTSCVIYLATFDCPCASKVVQKDIEWTINKPQQNTIKHEPSAYFFRSTYQWYYLSIYSRLYGMMS